MKVKASTARKTTGKPKNGNRTPKPRPVVEANGTPQLSGVMTLADAAAFLRVADESVLKLAEAGILPGRKVAGEWRFLEAKLREWLSQPEPDTEEAYHKRLMAMAGSMAHDDTAMEMLENIYAERRKHPVSEIQD
jgi:PTS system nitrogen regulatory IIA component